MQGVRSRRNVKLALERQTKQRVFQRLDPREPSLEGFRNTGLEGLSGVLFLVPDLEGRGRAHCGRLEVKLASSGIPSETSRVSETPLRCRVRRSRSTTRTNSVHVHWRQVEYLIGYFLASLSKSMTMLWLQSSYIPHLH